MANIDIARIEYALKTYYVDGGRVEPIAIDENPLLDKIPKGKTVGKNESLPIRYEGGQGVSNDASTALGNEDGGLGVEMIITTGDVFGSVSFDQKALEAATSPGAVMEEKRTETEDVIRAMGRQLSRELCGNGGAPLGRRASISTNTITLADKLSAHNFHVGMKLKASAGDGSLSSHSLRAGTAATVTAVDRTGSAPTVTVDNASLITSFADDDYLFREGSFAGDVSQTKVMKGLGAWFPLAEVSGSDSFFSVNRSVDSRLVGYRVPTVAGDYENQLKAACAMHFQAERGRPRSWWVNPITWDAIARSFQNANGVREIDVANSTGTSGYKGLVFMTPHGAATLMADPDIPDGICYMLDMSTLGIRCLGGGPIIKLANADGQSMRLKDGTYAYRMQWYGYNQPVCTKPWKNAVVALPTAL